VACNFEHGQLDHVGSAMGSDLDAPRSGDGAASSSDGAAGATWTVVETMTIPVTNGNVVTSTTTLSAGQVYHLRASGTYVTDTASNLLADADYYDYANPKDVTNTGTNCDVGIGIDDTVSDSDKQPKWGAYNTSHVYEIAFTGMGATIQANIHDGVYTNDTGELMLEILELR